MKLDFTDLVVLIGTNPLPNYVVIKYFLKNNDNLRHIWFICSKEIMGVQSGTEGIAEYIKKVIESEKAESPKSNTSRANHIFKWIQLRNVGSAQDIKYDLDMQIGPDMLNKGSVHLNYTGGTKSMAVHTYQYFHEKFGDRCPFSYLDGRDFKIKFDEGNFATKDLHYETGISLTNLYNLHNCEKALKQDKDESNRDKAKIELKKDLEMAMEEFGEIVKAGKLEEFQNWGDSHKEIYYSKGKLIKEKHHFLEYNNLFSRRDIEKFKRDFKANIPQLFYDLMKAVPKDRSILDENRDIWVPDESTTDTEYQKRTKSMMINVPFGDCFEAYVYGVIMRGIKNDSELKELFHKGHIYVAPNQNIEKKGTSKNFEIDMIVLNGYQVCGISCTTSRGQRECKNRGFEVMHRSKQIGGDEAKSILVTCLKNIEVNGRTVSFEDFYEDLKDITGFASHEFLALGHKHLKPEDLWRNIRKHIWGDV